ncbi:nuclear transport factor 2 family protein [Saccharothrix sp. AJ9571]|nr:nuclear transport factor 2 family protein [Saccharothrix sp. AJ9571]
MSTTLKSLGVLAGTVAMLIAGATSVPAKTVVEGMVEGVVEGEVSANAQAFIDRQTRFGAMPTNPERISLYADEIFDEHATLWEAAGRVIEGREEIRTAITGTLGKLPSFRMFPTRVAVDGNVVLYGAHNEAEIHGTTVSYPAIYRVVLGDDGKVIQGRRYYDRFTWFRGLDPSLENLFEGVRDGGSAPVRGTADRAAAWNNRDAAALIAGTGPLTGPGAGPLHTTGGKTAYLTRFFAKAESLQMRQGQTVRTAEATYQEWYGTVTTAERRTPTSFGIIERFDNRRRSWELTFDTLPLIAGQQKVEELYALL